MTSKQTYQVHVCWTFFAYSLTYQQFSCWNSFLQLQFFLSYSFSFFFKLFITPSPFILQKVLVTPGVQLLATVHVYVLGLATIKIWLWLTTVLWTNCCHSFRISLLLLLLLQLLLSFSSSVTPGVTKVYSKMSCSIVTLAGMRVLSLSSHHIST